ncbi:MAG: hypothetical protein AAFV33_26725, partial [Chloroflexota bacterium]
LPAPFYEHDIEVALMRLSTTILLAMAASFISACGAIVGPTAQEMTLQAQNNEMSTQIFDLRQTATVEVDRMMITVEHAQTEVSSVQLQRDAMRATSLARGTDPAFFEASIPGGNNLPVGITPEVLIPVDPNDPAVAPPITPAGAPVQPQGQPTQPAPQPTVPLDGPRLSSPTLTTSVGNDDCATASLNTFEAATPEIYIVATAMEFPANTTVTTTWTRDGQVMDSYDFTYDFEIDGACIWSFIDQTDFAFTPGNWAVQLQLSTGGGVGPLPFSITGGEDATMEEDAMMEEGS